MTQRSLSTDEAPHNLAIVATWAGVALTDAPLFFKERPEGKDPGGDRLAFRPRLVVGMVPRQDLSRKPLCLGELPLKLSRRYALEGGQGTVGGEEGVGVLVEECCACVVSESG